MSSPLELYAREDSAAAFNDHPPRMLFGVVNAGRGTGDFGEWVATASPLERFEYDESIGKI